METVSSEIVPYFWIVLSIVCGGMSEKNKTVRFIEPSLFFIQLGIFSLSFGDILSSGSNSETNMSGWKESWSNFSSGIEASQAFFGTYFNNFIPCSSNSSFLSYFSCYR